MKILIYGLPKSGTTGLFFLLKNSCGNNVHSIFEPDNIMLNKEIKSDNILVKTLLGQRCESLFAQFDKKILIIRDPRDWMISTFLYSTALHKIYDNNLLLSNFLNLLREKQCNTSNISFLELITYKINGISPWLDNDMLSNNLFINFIDYCKTNQPLFFVLKYEDFIDRNLSGLEQYLGFTLTAPSTVPDDYKRVERTKSYGDWKNWFTPKDVEYFKPILKEYMDYFGYSDWELPSAQKVLPSNGSTYVLRLVSEARKGKIVSFKRSFDEKLTLRFLKFDWISYLLDNPYLVSEGIFTKWGVIRHWLFNSCINGVCTKI